MHPIFENMMFCYGYNFFSWVFMKLIPSTNQISVSGLSFLAGISSICILASKWRPHQNGFENAIGNTFFNGEHIFFMLKIAFSKPFSYGLHFGDRIHMNLIPARNEGPDTEI